MMLARYIRPSLSLLFVMTMLLGVAYPLAITGLARAVFPSQAAGSLIHRGNVLVGSTLVGQSFSDPKYFWGRPSATAPQPYNGLASGGSNLGPLNPALLDKVAAQVRLLHDADPGNTRPVPVDLVTASASGLDPEISPAAAEYQASRVARLRNLPLTAVQTLITQHQKRALFDVLGETRVNVLELNLALDSLR
jgi:potassium-transporting ATPase KdpC subunit